ncbi:MAG: gliding motility-associated C-terminal domain-containing protein [Bacteroidota bacterium]
MIKNPFNLKCLKIFSLLFFLSFLTNDLYAQAGTSGAITICDKENYNEGAPLAPGQLSLFNIITGENPVGGVWSESTALPCTFGGFLNPTTGIVNIWGIRRGCIYTYTFTAANGSTSTVTLTLGGFPGVGTNGNACDDDANVNLFQFLGSSPSPDALNVPPFDGGGVFTCPAFPAIVSGNEFNATLPDPDAPVAPYPNYTIFYTVPATGTCPSRQSTFVVTINKKPEAGTTIPLYLCETDYLTFPTALDLQTLFNPTPQRDLGGEWTDETAPPFGNPTGGISGPPYGSANGIANTADSVINLRAIYDTYVGAFGHDTTHTDKDIELSFEYTVYPTHPICNPEQKATFTIVIERVIDLNVNGAPDPSITANPVGVCLNEATTTPIVMTINQNPMYPVENGTYDISYTLSGPNAAAAGGNATVPVTFSGGSGDITLNITGPVTAANVGVTMLCVTNAVENDSQTPMNMPPYSTVKCSRPVAGLCGTFEVYAAPDPSDTQVMVNDVCELGTNTVTISDINPGNGIQLVNGTYAVDYTLSCGGGGTLTFTVVNGTGTATLPILPDGTCTITLILFTNVTTTCESLPTNITTTFNVNLVPDATLMTVNTPDICVGNTLIVNLAGITSAPNGSYDITYEINPPGGAAGTFTQSVVLTGGAGSFTPTPILGVGTYTITITNITNGTCGTSFFLTPSDTFEIFALPTIAGVVLTAADVCAGQNVTVNMNDAPGAPDLANGTYTVNYTLNSIAQTPATVVYNNGSTPGGSFTITTPATGSNTVQVTSVTNSAGCTSTDGPVSVTFNVNPLPTITSGNVSVGDICANNPSGTTVTITGLADGNYNIDYTIGGANGGGAIVNVTVSSGIGTFPILVPTSTAGSTTITINSIMNTVTGCTAILTGVQATFNVNANPIINNGEITVADICLGNNATATIAGASQMPDGIYTINYDLSGANFGSYSASSVSISGGNGSFTILNSILLSPGSTTITITGLTNTTTGCSTSGLTVSAAFNIIPSVDVTPATASALPNPACILTSVVITVNTPLTAATYSFDYILNGVTNSVTGLVINGSGQGSFTIPGSQFPTGGTYTLVMQNFSSGGCPSTGSFSTTITVTETPAPTLVTDGNIFCIADGPTVGDLIANIVPNNAPTNVITVYNAPTGGTAYPNSTLLEQATTYYATLTANGCESETRLAVTVDLTNCADIVIPDGFSPNGDALNETFEIQFIDLLYPAYELEIYNRYGAMVYKGNINTPKFNGKSNQSTLGSDVVPVGIYFYILYYNNAAGKSPVQGRLYLSR